MNSGVCKHKFCVARPKTSGQTHCRSSLILSLSLSLSLSLCLFLSQPTFCYHQPREYSMHAHKCCRCHWITLCLRLGVVVALGLGLGALAWTPIWWLTLYAIVWALWYDEASLGESAIFYSTSASHRPACWQAPNPRLAAGALINVFHLVNNYILPVHLWPTNKHWATWLIF